MTLKEIANIIADGLNRPNDGLLINRIQRLILVEYNDLIREQITKYQYNTAFRTKYVVSDLSKVDAAIDGVRLVGKNILRTTNKIPTPVRLNRPQPFFYVGAIDGSNSFVYIEPYTIRSIRNLPLIANGVYYYYSDNYIYILNNLKLKEILIDCAFESLVISQNDINQDVSIYQTAAMEFPAPMDLIARIIEIIPKRFLNITYDKDKIEAGHADNN